MCDHMYNNITLLYNQLSGQCAGLQCEGSWVRVTAIISWARLIFVVAVDIVIHIRLTFLMNMYLIKVRNEPLSWRIRHLAPTGYICIQDLTVHACCKVYKLLTNPLISSGSYMGVFSLAIIQILTSTPMKNRNLTFLL